MPIGEAPANIVGGMCETDFSGYPDCRDDAIKAMQVALNLGMDTRFVSAHTVDVEGQGGDVDGSPMTWVVHALRRPRPGAYAHLLPGRPLPAA